MAGAGGRGRNASIALICRPQADSTAGVGCGVPAGIPTRPSARMTGSGTCGMPC
jgi:hypothetical protein